MATNYNYFGGIVTNGLVLDLDAAKLTSYPGTGTTWYDISGNNNNGTLTNGPTFSGIGKQAAIVFDNTDDYVVISSSAILAPRTGNFSNDFWINPTAWANNNYQPIQVTAITNGLWIGQNATNQFIVRAYGNADRLQYAIRPATGSWTNVSVTRNSDLITLYYNGTPVSSSISNQDFVQGTTYLGSDGVPSGGTVYFNGRIATDKYYNIGLSQFQVWQNFNAYKSRYGIPDIVTDGLVLNLDAGNPYSYLSGSSGTTWTNTVAVSSSISGTLVNGPIYSNGAITFDGVDDYVNCGTNIGSTLQGNTGITFEGWYNLANITTDDGLFSIRASGDGNWFWNIRPGGADFWVGYSTSTATNIVSITNPFTGRLNTWTHIATSFTSGSLVTYLNGAAVNTTTTIGGTINITAGATFTIGNYFTPGTYTMNGKIGNFRTYNRNLSPTEVSQNYNALRGRYGI